ncbi:Ger(x)C family spore germination protein [Paenibacillus sp. NEAU-GSW1]|uniref:Ger(x)C family spore germination protein n=1 Tax=Paenibacillus sp. NEAU-GSW1 TaxID=2682486 RepID=UPI001C12B499|nr:Ger(x)C family spore germination protein [Paenibacillus sp. NEAU-GSW1]
MGMHKWMRAASAIIAAFMCTILTTGCWDRVEVNDLAIVTGASFDLADNNKIKLSVQLYVPTGSSEPSLGGNPGNERAKPVVESAVGLNTADAASKLQELLSRRFFWGQSDVFIFGEALAKKGIEDPMEFLSRHPHPRERANIYIGKGQADTYLQWQPNIERNSAEVLREMSVLQTNLDITLLDVIIQSGADARSTLIPWIMMKPTGNKLSPYIGGFASFKGTKLNHWYNIQKTRGLLWLHDKIKTATLTMKPEGEKGMVSLQLADSRCDLSPSISNGKWMIKVKLEGRGDLIQNNTSLDVTKPEVTHMLEAHFAQIIVERLKSAVQTAQQEDSDVLGFANEFHRHYPKQWKTYGKQWESVFPTVEVIYDAKVTITRTGLIGKNTAILSPQEEE